MAGYVATDACAYERSMGRWSRMLAEPFLDACALPRGARVLDAGCGTGALAEAIAARDASARIAGVDVSEAFVAAAQARVPGGSFAVGDITWLGAADGAYDAALSLLVLQFVPDRAGALGELRRVTRAGGLVAAAMWDFIGGFPFLRAFMDSVAALMPEEGEAFRARYLGDSVGTPGRLGALFDAAGLRDVRECDIAIRQDFSDFADWWEPWELGQGIAGAFVVALDPARRAMVRDAARRAYLSGGADGQRSFIAVARLAVGRVG